ncbi:MAG: hypothetical protein ABI621_20500, partial [Chloroflexota bacterium]
MNPQELFCPNMDCPARGQTGKGNIHPHSQKDKRCICEVCGQTFTTTAGTIFLCRPLLLAVGGLASYVSAFRTAFRSKFP